MFARRVTINLKPNSVSEFTRKLEEEVIPMLQKQPGFRDELTFVATGDNEALAISLWDRKENAEAYSTTKYSEVVRMLGTVVEGTPVVQSGEVSNSTFHKIGPLATAKV